MTLYKKAWIFLIIVSVLVLTSPDWTKGVGDAIGASGTAIGSVVLALGAILFMFFFVCPKCSFSLFRSESIFGLYIYHPWPNKVCSRCGHNHSATEK